MLQAPIPTAQKTKNKAQQHKITNKKLDYKTIAAWRMTDSIARAMSQNLRKKSRNINIDIIFFLFLKFSHVRFRLNISLTFTVKFLKSKDALLAKS